MLLIRSKWAISWLVWNCKRELSIRRQKTWWKWRGKTWRVRSRREEKYLRGHRIKRHKRRWCAFGNRCVWVFIWVYIFVSVHKRAVWPIKQLEQVRQNHYSPFRFQTVKRRLALNFSTEHPADNQPQNKGGEKLRASLRNGNLKWNQSAGGNVFDEGISSFAGRDSKRVWGHSVKLEGLGIKIFHMTAKYRHNPK